MLQRSTCLGVSERHRLADVDLIAIAATPVLAYLLLVGVVALDAVFPALPSDAAVVSAGALAATGYLEAPWVAAAVVAGAMGGDHIVYQVGRRGLPGVLDRSRLGRRLHGTIDRAVGNASSVSFAGLAMGRFIPFGRTAAAASAGLAEVPLRRYVLISLVGAVSWAAWLAGLGYFTGAALSGPAWLQVGSATAVGVGVAVLVAAVARLIARRAGAGRGAQPEESTGEGRCSRRMAQSSRQRPSGVV